MSAASITAVALILSDILATGLTLTQVMKEVQATGEIKPVHWEDLAKDFDDAEKFWNH